MKKRPVFQWADPDKKFMVADLIPNEVFSAEYTHYKLDAENFNFNKIDERRKLFDREKIQKFLDAKNIKIGVDDFIAIYNFQDYMQMMWPEHAKNRPFREDVLRISRCNKDNPMLLSETFRRKIAACVECSLLAQMYFQHVGIESVMCCGNTFFESNPKIELGGGAHAYLIVKLGTQRFFYDPANPMMNSNGYATVPRIMSYANVPFRARTEFNDLLNMSVADGGGFAYVQASDIYGAGSSWFYGFESDDIENHVSRRRTAQGVKRPVPESSRAYQPRGREIQGGIYSEYKK